MGHDEELFMCDDYNAYRLRTRVLGWYPHVDNGEDADDASSMLTFSTTATTDNIPGAGRSVDTFLLPAGWEVDREICNEDLYFQPSSNSDSSLHRGPTSLSWLWPAVCTLATEPTWSYCKDWSNICCWSEKSCEANTVSAVPMSTICKSTLLQVTINLPNCVGSHCTPSGVSALSPYPLPVHIQCWAYIARGITRYIPSTDASGQKIHSFVIEACKSKFSRHIRF